eukprot:224039-Pleurochrysis_carterae.AAC.1
MLEQATKLPQSRCVSGVGKRALDGIHCPKSFVSGQKSTPAAATKITPSHKTNAPACRFSGIAMARPTVQ